MDYTIFYKSSYAEGAIDSEFEYDFFFSGFDDCDRTKVIFERVKASHKVWINFPHYRQTLTGDNVYTCGSFNEDEAFIALFQKFEIKADATICIDITGFIRPHLIYFLSYLSRLGLKKVDFFYTEPQIYKNAEDTTFSGFIDEVRLVEGCSSEFNDPNTDHDLLIIAAGYDDNLIARVSENKSKIKRKFYISGFPSLQPDMYQEGVLKMFNAKDSIGKIEKRFAPAFDPFVTAQTIHDIVESVPSYSNIYLSPLSTKPQTLGIALYYLWNYDKKPINIIFPYSNTYFVKTAIGIKKTWKYTIELP